MKNGVEEDVTYHEHPIRTAESVVNDGGCTKGTEEGGRIVKNRCSWCMEGGVFEEDELNFGYILLENEKIAFFL